MSNTSTANTSTEERAIELLSSGIEQHAVASALGVTESRISQILANPLFASKLAELKYEQLKKHNDTDNKYDALEKKVLAQLERTLALVMDPMKLARILTVLNSAKRRGASAPDSLVRTKSTVRLNISTQVLARFAVNGANQVVQASIGSDTQDLVTIQSGSVQRLLNESSKTALVIPAQSGSEESSGKVWRKPQGREKHDLLTELGFAHEITVSEDCSSEQHSNSAISGAGS
jgi:hypothetical protein